VIVAVVIATAAACLAVVPGASAAPARPAGGAQRQVADGPWGKAQEVPGTAILNKGHAAQINAVSCASAGNCTAGGYYAVAKDRNAPGVSAGPALQAFVISEIHGTWRKAEEVPGTAALNKDGYAAVTSVSCASAGNCSAAGFYAGNANAGDLFVVSEVHGTWRKAEEVPGIAALSQGGGGQIASLSCASPGNCSAGGTYSGVNGASEAMVVNEVHGRWRKAEEVPGIAALNQEGGGWVTSVSCASPGNCSAGGLYVVGYDEDGPDEGFVVSEVHGRWRRAVEVTGTAALDQAGGEITSVSCASAGNCSAGGDYSDGTTPSRAFVVSEVRGTWHQAEEVPGTAGFSNGDTGITSVSCASAGNCSAGGSFEGGVTPASEVFVVSEVKGTWRKAEEVPGLGGLAIGGLAAITSMSCASAGNCSAGGYYADHLSGSVIGQPFVVSEIRGRWRRAEEVPGIAALNRRDNAEILSLSCARGGHCSAGGFYRIASGTEAFVVVRT
jgi:hypothetical protein